MTLLPTGSTKNPTELLDMQVQVLNRIYQVQLKQQELLEKIRSQQEQLLMLPRNDQPNDNRPWYVKIVDFNMPFSALVGIMIKISAASIPATIIICVVITVIIFGLFFVLSMLGIGLTALSGV
jgi:hypothetical protein